MIEIYLILEFQCAMRPRNPSSYGGFWRAEVGPLALVDGGVRTCSTIFWRGMNMVGYEHNLTLFW